MLTRSTNFNINYAAKIVEIQEFRNHNNPEVQRLKCCKVDGFNIITGIDSEPGFYLYFPVECQIDTEFLHLNSLFRDSTLNKDTTKKGMFEKTARVKVINLLGEKSEGFIIPIDSLDDYTPEGMTMKIEPDKDFDTYCGKLLCQKYIPKGSRTPGAPGSRKGKSPKRQALAKIVDEQFKFHVDTTQIKKVPYVIKPDSLISITAKVHGTSGISSNVLIRKPIENQSWWSKLIHGRKFEEVYHSFCTSRKVIKDPLLNSSTTGQGWYGGTDDEGRRRIHKEMFEPILKKGMTIYYEIIGYWPSGSPIQGKWDYGYSKPESAFEWTHGKNYGVEVYRITYTNTSGIVFEFSARQVQQWCRANNIPAVEEYYYGYAKDLYPELNVENHWNQNFLEKLCEDQNFYMELKSPRCFNAVPHEGIVIRNESLNIEVYKLKCFEFLEKEKKQNDKGIIDTESLEE